MIRRAVFLFLLHYLFFVFFFFFQAEDGIRDADVTGVQTCALPIYRPERPAAARSGRSSPRPPTRSPSWRSEERRVGKECRSRWAREHLKKKKRRSMVS